MKYLPKILRYLEMIAVTLLLAGGLFEKLTIEGGMILVGLALSMLACVYFLQAYVPSDVKIKESNSFGFKDLLTLSILPKVFGISMSVAIVGIQFFLLQLEGYPMMITIGTFTIVTAYFIALVLRFSGAYYFPTLVPILFRAFIILASVLVLFLYSGLELQHGNSI